jgi:hypothetical protein
MTVVDVKMMTAVAVLVPAPLIGVVVVEALVALVAVILVVVAVPATGKAG